MKLTVTDFTAPRHDPLYLGHNLFFQPVIVPPIIVREKGAAIEAAIKTKDSGAPAKKVVAQTQTATMAPAAMASATDVLTLLDRAKGGDHRAFEQIYEMYQERVFKYVMGKMNHVEDAQDITQDTFLKLHDALPHLEANGAFTSYLYTTALNLCRDRGRRRSRVRFESIETQHLSEEGEGEPMEFADDARLPAAILESQELQQRVRAAINQLSKAHKDVIRLHHYEHLEVNEIGRRLGVPGGTIKSRLSRGRKELARRLATAVR